MGRGSRYCNIVSSSGVLIIYTLIMLITAILFSYTATLSNSISPVPALAGFVDIEQIPHTFSLIAGIVLFVLTIMSVYCVSESIFASARRSEIISLMYALIVLINPSAILFSGVSLASLAMVWSIYFMIRSKNNSSAIFISPFLASVASLFSPYIIFAVPILMFFVLNLRSPDMRSIAVSFAGALFPYIFVFSLRYIFFDDSAIFAELLRAELMNFSMPKIKAASIPEILQIILLIVVALNSARSVIKSLRFYRTEESLVLSKMIILLLLLVLVNAVYSNTYSSYMAFIALPMAFIVCEYVNPIGDNRSKIRGVDMLILLLVIFMNRVNLFI